MEKIRITQKRSVIKRPKRQKETIKALGLKRINHSVDHKATEQIKGMVRKVNHLITVEEIK